MNFSIPPTLQPVYILYKVYPALCSYLYGSISQKIRFYSALYIMLYFIRTRLIVNNVIENAFNNLFRNIR